MEDSVGFTLTTNALLPNTQYWVIIAGAADNGAVIPAQCGFSISTSGPGAQIVGVDFFAGPDIVIAEGQSTQLSATGGTTYTWSPTSGLSGSNIPDPLAEPSESTIYTVTTTINGCTYTDDQIVEVVRLIDPTNTITPNEDGMNDTWTIHGIQDYPQADVSIYDRWGQRVFHSVGYKEPFDGEGLPTATYYWVIELNERQGHSDPYVGYLAIIR
jgi:gliding motility-associated-like protein